MIEELPEVSQWDRGYNAAVRELVRPLETRLAQVERDRRWAVTLFEAAVTTMGEIRIEHLAIMQPLPITRIEWPTEDAVIYRVQR